VDGGGLLLPAGAELLSGNPHSSALFGEADSLQLGAL